MLMYFYHKMQPFKTLADDAKEGFVVFSLGSAIPVSSMPKETFEAFMKTFAKLKQRIFCKWEGELPDKIPSNIFLSKWLPQQDLLGIP